MSELEKLLNMVLRLDSENYGRQLTRIGYNMLSTENKNDMNLLLLQLSAGQPAVSIVECKTNQVAT